MEQVVVVVKLTLVTNEDGNLNVSVKPWIVTTNVRYGCIVCDAKYLIIY